MIKIAILGFGVVGAGVADILADNYKEIKGCIGDDIEICKILDRRDFPGSLYENKVTHDINDILNDPKITVVCEMMGGVHPAYEFSLASIRAGKSVVTSNKAVVAEKGPELTKEAEKAGVHYLFEASVGGGIPIIHAMNSSLSGCRINAIDGILNGTTNYILTQMAENGTDYSDALLQAQKLGYAEADPTADVKGFDACRKICILGALAWGKLYNFENVYCRGIDGITNGEKEICEAAGGKIKLIASAVSEGNKNALWVSPTVVTESSPMYGVSGVFNSVKVYASGIGDVMFYGMGAGKLPTASAVMSDVIDIVSGRAPKIEKWEMLQNTDIDYKEVRLDFCLSVKRAADEIKMIFTNAQILSENSSQTLIRINNISENEIKSKLGCININSIIRILG